MKNKRIEIVAYIVTLFHVVSYGILAFVIHQSKLVPAVYEGILLALCLIWSGLLILLSKKLKKIWLPVVLMVLTVMLSALYLVAGYHLNHVKETLEGLTAQSTEVTQVSVFVADTDEAEAVSDIKDYKVGILANLNRDNTDKAIAMMEEEMGVTLSIVEYESVLQLADGMREGEIAAFVLNESYLDIFSSLSEDTEEVVLDVYYLEFVDSIKKIAEYSIEQSAGASEMDLASLTYEDNGSFLAYISGIDKFGHISVCSRSDVNIIAAVNTNTKEVLLVSIPRDYYVPLSISDYGTKDKLTHAALYGVNCSIDTVENFTGLTMDYYLKINFSGFESIIDALGGITVWSDYAFDVEPCFHYAEGNNELSGLEALAFARERYSFSAGDNQRGRNQMNVIISVINKCTSSAVLKNFTEVLDSAEGTFETDMPYDTMASIVRQQLVEGSEWNISTYSLTGTGSRGTTYSLGGKEVYVMEPSQESIDEAVALIQDVLE